MPQKLIITVKSVKSLDNFEIDENKEFIDIVLVVTFSTCRADYLAITGNKPCRWVTSANILLRLICNNALPQTTIETQESTSTVTVKL